MVRRTKEEAQATRRQIMDAALCLFSQHGVSRTSLVDIARQSDVTRGAIYWHFCNKEELFSALWQEFCGPMMQLIVASSEASEPDPLGKLRLLLIEMLTLVAENPRHQQMFRILHSLLLRDVEDTELRNMLSLELRFYLERLHDALRHAIDKQQLPARLDTRRAAVFLQCTLDGFILNWLSRHEDLRLPEQAVELVDGLLLALQHGACWRPATADGSD